MGIAGGFHGKPPPTLAPAPGTALEDPSLERFFRYRIMKNNQKPKRRHHFVQKRYLESWMSEDGKLWHSHKGQIRKANPINVAVKNNFYRIIDLTPIDIDFLMTWCSLTPTVDL